MISIEEVAEKTYRFEASIPGVGLIFSIYLIDTDGGILIEPGPSALIPFVQQAMKQLGMQDLSLIIPTHIHMDHGGATGNLTEFFTGAKVIAHPKGASHMINPDRLIQSTRKTYGEHFEATFGPISPILDSRMMVPEDGDIIAIGVRELQILHAPGHAPHHIAIFDLKTRGLFCGESLGMATADPLPAPSAPGFNLDDYLLTLRKLQSLKPKNLFYSHGGTWEDPDKRIPRVIENTRIYADMVLDFMKQHETRKTMYQKVTEFAENQFPAEWGEDMIQVWITGVVEGYTGYFRKTGLV